MTRILALSTLLATGCLSTATAPATADVGSAAPDFTLPGTDGEAHTLSDHKGKVVVLEWYNPDCPFVKYAHGEGGPLRTLGDAATKEGVVWWAINSGAPGKQGHGAERNKASKAEYAFAYPVLLDEDGTVGKAYDAKTTPQMVIVGADGQIVYEGGLDNAPLGDAKGSEPVPYFARALDEVQAGKPVTTPATKPYGCSVKY